MYRAVDTGLRTIDVRTLTEAAQILGAGWATIIARVILPNVLIAVLSGAFLTFAIVIGEFTMASLLNRPAFGPYLQNIGANRAYEPAALAIIAFAITWGCMSLIQILSRFAPKSSPTRLIGKPNTMAEPFLSIQHVRKTFGDNTVVQDFNLDVGTRRVRLLPRSLGLRQDDGAAHGRRLREADRRHRSSSAARTSRG